MAAWPFASWQYNQYQPVLYAAKWRALAGAQGDTCAARNAAKAGFLTAVGGSLTVRDP
jgi:hypothetical protein